MHSEMWSQAEFHGVIMLTCNFSLDRIFQIATAYVNGLLFLR